MTAVVISSTSLTVNDLSHELLAEILLYADFSSACTFCHCIGGSLQRQIQQSSPKSNFHHVWKLIYDRHHFAPIEKCLDFTTRVDYATQINSRRQLLFNLFQMRKKKSRNNRPCCFNIPNRRFYFKPVIPAEFDIETEDEIGNQHILDPPPVVYECDSFVLTSCGTSPELLLLDPFDGRLSVISDISTHCVASDEAFMEQVMFQAGDAVVQVPRSKYFADMMDTEIAGHRFEECIVPNLMQPRLKSPQNQELITQDDLFNLDLSSFFQGSNLESGTFSFTENQEFDLLCQGVDAKPILEPRSKTLLGCMIGLGRTVTSVDDISVGCTELTLWSRTIQEAIYTERLVCRYPWSVGYLDFDPIHRRVFANKSSGPMAPRHDAQTVVVFPMVPWVGEEGGYFPLPLGTFRSLHAVVVVVVDSLGEKLLLGTDGGTIEIWDVSLTGNYNRLAELKVVDCLQKSINEWVTSRVQVLKLKSSKSSLQSCTTTTTTNKTKSSPTEEDAITFRVLKRQPNLPVFQSNIDFIFLPKHLSLEQAGIVTLQYHSEEGSSLLLWRNHNNGELKVASLINLRILPRQKPRVHFDGNRLIVFGQDHIGVIILVYHVSTGDNQVLQDDNDSISGEQSGGVYNLTDPPQIRFANRIRHAALGGIDQLDTMHMTVNERFIIVNTKTGNLLGEEASFLSEGLLVIDLQDQGVAI
ncbi:hypothetical protein IV203_016952 [Nitzschia inconspicua]|uniref:Uncharacterized protein n=1 Tax=Nitzschia inconspicua TaxID=303405 RepID=A0A9K3KRM1_9STRA|nr:hypothetical protein IV203_016952 [Nitzschia inconspicua]